MIYLVYGTTHGGIFTQVDAPTLESALQEVADPDSQALLEWPELVDDGAVRVDPETQRLVPKSSVPHTVSGTTLSSVPPGTAVEVLDELYYADDTGVVEFAFAEPGTYEIILSHVAYLETRVTIHAD